MSYVRAEMKSEARSQLSGKWGAMIGAALILALVNGIITFVFYVDPTEVTPSMSLYYSTLGLMSACLTLLIVSPLNLGWYEMLLAVLRREPVLFSDIFKGFKRIWPAVLVTFFYGLFTFLWSLLLLIPGIIKSYSYAMAYYILADDENIKPLDAITKSRHMMNGHKAELFVLHLSFIPWVLLVAFTFGLATLYVAPYMGMTVANFYRRLKAENEVNSYMGYSQYTAGENRSQADQHNTWSGSGATQAPGAGDGGSSSAEEKIAEEKTTADKTGAQLAEAKTEDITVEEKAVEEKTTDEK